MNRNFYKLFADAYNVIFEADQSKMTPDQIKKDIEKRNKAHSIGIEIEFYTHFGDPDDVENYITNDLGLLSRSGELLWDATDDASLNPDVDLHNPFNEELENDAVGAIESNYGRSELESVVIDYLDESIADELYIIKNILDKKDELDTDDEEYENQVESMESEIEETIDNSEYPDITRDLAEDEIYSVYEMRASNISHALDILETDVGFDKWLYDRYIDESGLFLEIPEGYNEIQGTEGVEIRFVDPRKLSDLDNIMDEIQKIVDSDIDPITFDGTADGDSATGLHVHFGLSQHEPTNLDLIRLMVNSFEEEDLITDLAGRKSNYWARSISKYVTDLVVAVTNSTGLDYIELPSDKFMGTSFHHIGGKNTVEFRWGHSNLIYDTDKLRKYIDALISLINKSFTGSDSMEYNGYTIKEISKGSLTKDNSTFVVIRDGKVIKKLKASDKVSEIKTKGEKSTEQLDNIISEISQNKEIFQNAINDIRNNIKEREEIYSRNPEWKEKFSHIEDIEKYVADRGGVYAMDDKEAQDLMHLHKLFRRERHDNIDRLKAIKRSYNNEKNRLKQFKNAMIKKHYMKKGKKNV